MFYTELNNRKLFFDGSSSFDPSKILRLQSRYKIKYVDHMTPMIEQYNRLSKEQNKIRVKQTCEPWDLSWNIPDKYKKLDIVEYVLDKHIDLTEGMSDEEITDRDNRLIVELTKFQQMDKLDILRTIIYIVEVLNEHDVVYGVGRGSGVSSYVLYVIGIHDIDSYAFDLDIDDFLHE